MPRKFIRKDTVFNGLIQEKGTSKVSSFQGRIDGGALKYYIGVHVEDEWLTVAQAKRLAKLLEAHVSRVENAEWAAVLKKRKTRTRL